MRRASRPTAACTCRSRCRASTCAAFDGVTSIPAVAEVLLRPFAAGDAHREPGRRQSSRDAFNFPAPVVEVHGAGGPLSVLELFHGPTAAFKDFGARFLAASLERIPRTDPRRLTILVATSGDTGGAVAAAFYQASLGRRRRALSEGPGLAAPGEAARLLGRQRAHAGRRRHLRRLPAHGQGSLRRPGAGPRPAAVLRQQHQRRPPAAADGLLRAVQPRTVPPRRARAELHRALGQPRQRRRVPLGAQGGPADRRGGARDQRQPDRAGLPAHGRVATAPEPRYACVRHGRRQPEQHGTTALAVPRRRTTCATQFSAYSVSDDEIRATIRRDYARATARPGARTRRPRRTCTGSCPRRAAQGTLGAGRHRASRPSSTTSSSRSSAPECRCRRRSPSCCHCRRCSATWRRASTTCARAQGESRLEDLPRTAALAVGRSSRWRWSARPPISSASRCGRCARAGPSTT